MPDTTAWPSATASRGDAALDPSRRTADATRIDDLIRLERRPLPAHDLDGVNARQWAIAVCGAEVKHRASDFSRCEVKLGVSFDRWDHPAAEQMGQFDHEVHAGAALNWLTHLQAHDSDRRGPWANWNGWGTWDRERRIVWLRRRRYLVHGFLRQIAKYKAARREFDLVPVRRAA